MPPLVHNGRASINQAFYYNALSAKLTEVGVSKTYALVEDWFHAMDPQPSGQPCEFSDVLRIYPNQGATFTITLPV